MGLRAEVGALLQPGNIVRTKSAGEDGGGDSVASNPRGIPEGAAFGSAARDVRAADQGEGEAAEDQAIQSRVVVQAVRTTGDELGELTAGPGTSVCADGQPEGGG